MRMAAIVLLAVLTVNCMACGKKNSPRVQAGNAGQPQPAPAGPIGVTPGGGITGTPFLQGTKDVPARMEWNRDFGSKNGGTVAFRVTSNAPFGITIVTDKGYQAVKSGSKKVNRSDGLFFIDAKPPSYEGRVNVPPGMAWFIIENQSDATATIRLECYDAR